MLQGLAVASYEQFNRIYREGPNHFRINFATAILQYLLLGQDSMINAALMFYLLPLVLFLPLSLIACNTWWSLTLMRSCNGLVLTLWLAAFLIVPIVLIKKLCTSGVKSYGWREAWFSRMQRSLFSSPQIGEEALWCPLIGHKINIFNVPHDIKIVR